MASPPSQPNSANEVLSPPLVTLKHGINSNEDDDLENQLLSYLVGLTHDWDRERREKLVLKLGASFSNLSNFKTLITLHRLRAATWPVIQKESGVPQQSLSRALKDLENLGSIIRTTRQPLKGLKGGPHPSVYTIKGFTESDIQKALETHLIASTPGQKEAERIGDILLEQLRDKPLEWQQKETNESEILSAVRANSRGYNRANLADLVKDHLRRNGVKVWVRGKGP